MKNDKGETNLGQVPGGHGFEPEMLAAVVRIAVALEHIEQLLTRQPAPSRREKALIDLLGEAPRTAPTPQSQPEHVPEHPGPPFPR